MTILDMTEYDGLHSAAGQTEDLLERARGIVEQIRKGQWDGDLTPAQAMDLTACLSEAGEVARLMRSDAGQMSMSDTTFTHWPGPLPFNRKERFYTGTVLPGIVGANGFWHIQRLLDLFGLPAGAEVGEHPKIQFLTEYGFAESVYLDDDRATWGQTSTRETPDIVIVGPDWLLAIEAKMYHAPSAGDLKKQMTDQWQIVQHWRDVLEFPPGRVVHALLLPDRLARRERAGLADQTVVTWESVLESYRHVGPSYWVSLLDEALRRHKALESRSRAAVNAEDWLAGGEIVSDAQSDHPRVGFVGRAQGAEGARFAADVASGGWLSQKYQVRSTPVSPSNPHWMPVAAFLAAVAVEQSVLGSATTSDDGVVK